MANAGARRIRVLEADPDLATGLDPAQTVAAERALVVPLVTVDWRTQAEGWGPRDPAGYLGLLVVEGLILREVELLGIHSAELLGFGDLLRPWDADGEEELPVPAHVTWRVLEPVSLAALDPVFVRLAASWPVVLSALARRAVLRAKFMALNDAITNVNRVDTRLLLLFWHLAERWGKVGLDSVLVPLPLSHKTLGKLIGAARPSVTTALSALADRDLLLREEGGWLLSRDVEQAFGPMAATREAPRHQMRAPASPAGRSFAPTSPARTGRRSARG